jgi:hypothetical protein
VILKEEEEDSPESEQDQAQLYKMVKKLIQMTIERDNLQQKWGFLLQGGQDMTLTLKVSTVKAGKLTVQNLDIFCFLDFHPGIHVGLEKMDYVYTVNGKEVLLGLITIEQCISRK